VLTFDVSGDGGGIGGIFRLIVIQLEFFGFGLFVFVISRNPDINLIALA
jgi:hypothetical protein